MFGIEESRKEVLNTINSLTDEELNLEVEKDRWTIAQVAQHLVLMEDTVTTLLKKEIDDSESRPAERLKPIERTVDRTYKVEAPAHLEPEAGFYSKEELVQRLDQSRLALQDLLSQIDELSLLTEKSAKHPVFGRMNLAQWVEFIGVHELRHHDQMKELKVKI